MIDRDTFFGIVLIIVGVLWVGLGPYIAISEWRWRRMK